MISPEEIALYREQGYLLLRAVLPADECEELGREIDAIASQVAGLGDVTWPGAWRGRLDATWDPTRSRVLGIHDLHLLSARFTRLMQDERLTGPVAALIGPDVALHHIKMHLKPAGAGSPFPLHQDYPYFPHEGDSMIAAVLHVDPSPVDGGGFCVVPGTHRLGIIPCEREGSFYLPPEEWPLSRAVPCPAAAGDVLLLHYKVVHGSYPNRGPRDRRIVLIQYRSPFDLPTVERHLSPGQGTVVRGRGFRQAAAAEPAAGPETG